MRWKKQCIYIVPAILAGCNQDAYIPHRVSLGPFHHPFKDSNAHLKPMEEHKQRALIHFLRHSRCPINDYLDALQAVEKDLIECYSVPFTSITSDEFLLMLLREGCFLLEIHRTTIEGNFTGYVHDDAIFGYHRATHVLPFVRRDMLVLHNQIPLLVLRRLLDSAFISCCTRLNRMVLDFFQMKDLAGADSLGVHMLDAYRRCLVRAPTSALAQREASAATGGLAVRSAATLHDARVKFRPSTTKGLMDVHFTDGVLYLPHLIIDDTTESKFLNLLAFESLHVGAGCEVSSYVWFMDNLIDTAKDVDVLRFSSIIENAMGSDAEVADLFNRLSKELTMDSDGRFATFIGLVAAVLLLLTLTQALYAVLAYHKPPPN
ncbi:hypothetical protein AMTRI_Chr06g193940 [Amborella trichopoda]